MKLEQSVDRKALGKDTLWGQILSLAEGVFNVVQQNTADLAVNRFRAVLVNHHWSKCLDQTAARVEGECCGLMNGVLWLN